MSSLVISSPSSWPNPIERKTLCSKEQQPEFTDNLAKIAFAELREDENSRKQCLQQLREWIKKNKDIENCLTDDVFLLRFLRVKKFSIPMAQQTLLKYLNFRKRFHNFYSNLDYLQNDLIAKGYIFVSPFRDGNGRRVIIYNASAINPQEIKGPVIAQAHAIIYETLLAEEENQILGVNHVGDLNGFNASFLTLFSIPEFAQILRWAEQSIPIRHKAFNMLNFPSALKFFYDFVQSNIRNEKLKSRIFFHNSKTELSTQVNKHCLPLELGGIMSSEEMIKLWNEELAAKREYLLSYDVMNLLSDKGIIRSRKAPDVNETESLSGSFRKLEVD